MSERGDLLWCDFTLMFSNCMLRSFIKGAHTKTDILLFRTIDYVGFFAFLLNPIPTRLCHMIYYHGDKKYSYLVGIGLNDTIHSGGHLSATKVI